MSWGFRWVGDEVTRPNRLDGGPTPTAGELSDRVDELRRPEAIGDGVDGAEASDVPTAHELCYLYHEGEVDEFDIGAGDREELFLRDEKRVI